MERGRLIRTARIAQIVGGFKTAAPAAGNGFKIRQHAERNRRIKEMYGTTEEKIKAAEERVKEYRDAAALYPEIAKVIVKFGGKVYNKRFQTALQETTGKHIYSERRNDLIWVYIYGPGGRQYELASYRRAGEEDKRLDAEKMLESARSNREKYLKTAYEIERATASINTHIAYIKELEQRLDSYRGALPWEVRDIFCLNRRW